MTYKDPLEVNQSNFPVKEENLLYNDEGYSIAISQYGKNGYHGLGIRWNDSKGGIGFPYGFEKRARWMIIPDNLAIPMLEALSELKEHKVPAGRNKILDAIAMIKSER